jgi:hypothetical protein
MVLEKYKLKLVQLCSSSLAVAPASNRVKSQTANHIENFRLHNFNDIQFLHH